MEKVKQAQAAAHSLHELVQQLKQLAGQYTLSGGLPKCFATGG